MRYAAFLRMAKSGFFCDGTPVGVRSVAGCIAFSVPLASV